MSEPGGPAVGEASAGALGPALGPEGLERARRFIAIVPHAVALGITLDRVGEGWAELSMPWDARFVGDPRTGVIHGGAVSALMDTCCGTAVLSLPGAAGTATIDLRIDYMRPATPGQRIAARAECYHVTRAVVFLRATATDDDSARPVAMATGTFTLERAPEAGTAGPSGRAAEGGAEDTPDRAPAGGATPEGQP